MKGSRGWKPHSRCREGSYKPIWTFCFSKSFGVRDSGGFHSRFPRTSHLLPGRGHMQVRCDTCEHLKAGERQKGKKINLSFPGAWEIKGKDRMKSAHAGAVPPPACLIPTTKKATRHSLGSSVHFYFSNGT